MKKLASAKEDTNKVKTLLRISGAFRLDNSEKSLDYAKQALGLSEKLAWGKGIANAYNNIGRAYDVVNDNDKALEFYFKSLQIMEELKDKKGTGFLNNNIGVIYWQLGNYEKALEYLQNGLKINLELGEDNNLVNSYVNIGNIYTSKGDYSQALEYFFTAAELAEKYKNTVMLSVSYNNIGDAYNKLGNYQKALEYVNKGLAVAEKAEKKNLLSYSYVTMGEIYYNQKKYKKAIVFLNKCIAITKIIGNKAVEKEACLLLSKIYLELKNYKMAYQYDKLYQAVNDSINNEQVRKHIANLEAANKMEKNQQKIALLSKTNEIQELKLNQNRYLIGGLIGLMIFVLIISMLFIRQIKLNDNHKALSLEQKALRAQMNPHFLFNSLNSIQKFIVDEDQKNALVYLSKFSTLVRSILDNSDKIVVPMIEELNAVKLYLDIEQLRVEDSFVYTIEIDPQIDSYNVNMPSMLIQPSIENAIWHGLMNKKAKGNIKINVIKKADKISFTITDDGIGRKKAQELENNSGPRHKSSGINLVKDRIMAINAITKKNIEFQIEDLYNDDRESVGTKVEIIIPFGMS
ncbi:MAG TPA: tetratricopeptide repeat protein [Chitinophagaceae bacterium]|nr:tetratricopeptide repeat protein [Chitinophagaceae bacterium]